MKFDHPKVADVVAFLLTLPQDKAFEVVDADTDWVIVEFDIDHLDGGDDTVTLFPSSYSEMEQR